MTTLLKALSLSAIMAFAAPAYSQIMLNVGIGLPHARVALNVGSPMPHEMWVPGYYAEDRMSRRAWIPGRWQVPPERSREMDGRQEFRDRDRSDNREGRWQDRREGRRDDHDQHYDRDRRER